MSSLPATFWAKVQKTDTCWIWAACINSRGYGCFSVDGKRYLTHRLAYADANGDIPEGLTVDHLCGIKRCVNPAHLEAVTAQENILRYHAQFTTCKTGHGHELVRRPDGRQRVCRVCEATAKRRRRREAKQKAGVQQIEGTGT